MHVRVSPILLSCTLGLIGFRFFLHAKEACVCGKDDPKEQNFLPQSEVFPAPCTRAPLLPLNKP